MFEWIGTNWNELNVFEYFEQAQFPIELYCIFAIWFDDDSKFNAKP